MGVLVDFRKCAKKNNVTDKIALRFLIILERKVLRVQIFECNLSGSIINLLFKGIFTLFNNYVCHRTFLPINKEVIIYSRLRNIIDAPSHVNHQFGISKHHHHPCII